MDLSVIQKGVDAIHTPTIPSLHTFDDVPNEFKPWESGLSPSALYNCSLTCRKLMGYKTSENKWVSIKRWISKTPMGINLPPGIYLSVKRKEEFVAAPKPHFKKTEFTLMMFPYGNVWSQKGPDDPITEDWLWSDVGGMSVFEALVRKDAAQPVKDYFVSCHQYMIQNPDQLNIHLKRKSKMKMEFSK